MAVRPFLRALVPAFLAAALLPACDGGGGDTPSDPVKSVLGNGHRVSELVGPATWYDTKNANSLKCALPANKSFFLTGLSVMAVDHFDEVPKGASGNLYLQDTTKTPGDYEGILIFNPAFTPPSLRVAAGDVLDTFGVYSEFLGPSTVIFEMCKTLPEMSGTSAFRFEDSPTPAKVVTLQDVRGYKNARRYLSMLVTVNNVTLATDGVGSSSTLPTMGRYTATVDMTGTTETDPDTDNPLSISNELYDIFNEGPVLKAKMKFKSVTGILTYFKGFQIAPRSPADLVAAP